MNIPNRTEYLKKQGHQGQKIMGVLPALYPRELLWAFDILPAEIWDPPGDILHANAHLQTTICPVVKRSLEFILTESPIINTGYLFPHTCDSLQNLATQVKDLIGVPVPVHTFYNPKGSYNRASRKYYTDILENFMTELETIHGSLDPQKLLTACMLGWEIDIKRIEIQNARMANRLPLSNVDYFKLIRAAEFMLPNDYLEVLKSVELTDTVSPPKTRILISGILPPGDEALQFLDELNISIGADDLLASSRRLPADTMDAPEIPFEYLTDRFFLQPPCSTRAGSLDVRSRHIHQLISKSDTQAVWFNMVKFCEPELFDHHLLVKELKKSGLPVLTLDTELQSGIAGQDRTRLEAFSEILLTEVVA